MREARPYSKCLGFRVRLGLQSPVGSGNPAQCRLHSSNRLQGDARLAALRAWFRPSWFGRLLKILQTEVDIVLASGWSRAAVVGPSFIVRRLQKTTLLISSIEDP